MQPRTPEENVGMLKEIRSVIDSLNVEYKEDGSKNNILLKVCPFCGDDRFKFYLGINFDNLGLWNCFHCQGESIAPAPKAWSVLRKHLLGEENFFIQPAYSSRPKTAFNDRIDTIKEWHKALKGDVEVMRWLHTERGISPSSMERYHLGISIQEYGDPKEKVKTLVIPYFYKHNLVNAKFRVLPPRPKGFFRIPRGESILYNYDNIDLTKKYIFICEGELDAISLAQAGETNVVSITVGAKSFLPEWYDLLKRFEIIYLVLDNDTTGQEGAKILAERLGPERCYNIMLPSEIITLCDGTTKTLKDLNDYFLQYNIDEFKSQALKATKFELNTIYSLDLILDSLEHKLKSEGSIAAGLETPWPSLNTKMGPMAKGDLIYLSGKPKTGKSTMALNICYNLSYNEKIPTLFFCLEMPPERLGAKLISRHRGVDTGLQEITLEDIYMTRNDFTRGSTTIPLYFGYSTDKQILYDADSLLKIFKAAKRKYGLEFIVFDNIQYLCRSTTNVPQIVAKLSRDFKLMAMEFKIPVMVVAQPVKMRNEEIMTASHMRDTGSLEADADTVIILNRHRYPEQVIKSQDLQNDKMESGVISTSVDRSRYSAGGFTRLFLEGGKSFIREATEADYMGTVIGDDT
jgi:5S rRNA maturation endonuclease (ribonuclease M5)/KaiC/GvpD/RAD55 family RecA-like ATPase